jgi:hypothetical protein
LKEGTASAIEEMSGKLKKVMYEMDIIRRMVENTTDIDRVRDDMDAVILRMRKVEVA